MNVGKRITFKKKKKNYSVNKLATLSGISQSYLRDIELGNKNPGNRNPILYLRSIKYLTA